MTKARLTAMLLISIASIAILSGCGEDRSNLLPGNTAREIIANLDTVDQLVSDGKCFDALESTQKIRLQVEALSEDIDPVLKRNLLDGVTELQIKIQGECNESDTEPTPAPIPDPAPEPDPTQTTGSTGTTDSTGTTGATGTTGTTGGGDTSPKPTPPATPTPPPKPEPNPGNTGSGGFTPGSGGVGP